MESVSSESKGVNEDYQNDFYKCQKCRRPFAKSLYFAYFDHVKKCGVATPVAGISVCPVDKRRAHYRCSKCQRIFVKSTFYFKHIKECCLDKKSVGVLPLQVSENAEAFRENAVPRDHRLAVDYSSLYRCFKCGKMFVHSIYYNKHVDCCKKKIAVPAKKDIAGISVRTSQNSTPIAGTSIAVTAAGISVRACSVSMSANDVTSPADAVSSPADAVPSPAGPAVQSYRCDKCQRIFARKNKYYDAHIEKCTGPKIAVPRIRKKADGTPIIEPAVTCEEEGCTFSCCSGLPTFRKHLENAHGKHMNMIKKTFKDKKEFDAWNYMISKSYSITWIVSRTHALINGRKATNFACNRSGVYSQGKLKNLERVRRMRKIGSVKCGRRCTASMQTTLDPDGSISVRACTTHYGHDIEASKQKIHPVDKKIIVSRILQDIPMKKIIQTNRITAPATSRLSLLTPIDISNIMKSKTFGRDKKLEDWNAEDLAAVSSIVGDGQSHENDHDGHDQLNIDPNEIFVLRGDLINSWSKLESLLHTVDNSDTLRRMCELLDQAVNLASVSIEPVLPPAVEPKKLISTVKKPRRASPKKQRASSTKQLASGRKQSASRKKQQVSSTKRKASPAKKRQAPHDKKRKPQTDSMKVYVPWKPNMEMLKLAVASRQEDHVTVRDAIAVEQIMTATVLDEMNAYEYSVPALLYYVFADSSVESCIKDHRPLKLYDIKLVNVDPDHIDPQFHECFLQYHNYTAALSEYMDTPTLNVVRNIVSDLVDHWRCDSCQVARMDKKMIACNNCHKWYHWSCVGFLEANEINVRKLKRWFCKKRTCIAASNLIPLKCK